MTRKPRPLIIIRTYRDDAEARERQLRALRYVLSLPKKPEPSGK